MAVRPYCIDFLDALRGARKDVVMVTNAHHDSLALKMDRTRIAPKFDRLITVHEFSLPKEDPQCWHEVHKRHPFDADRTLLIDDNLQCAGIGARIWRSLPARNLPTGFPAAAPGDPALRCDPRHSMKSCRWRPAIVGADEPAALEGGCLCGGVRYRITGPRRNIVCCHCENCRRTHGHFAAYTAVQRADMELLAESTLRWYHDVSPDAYLARFCSCCGASLFWDARDDGQGRLSVAAGSLDDSAELETVGHIFVSEAGCYYRIDDGLPRFERGSGGAFESDSDG